MDKDSIFLTGEVVDMDPNMTNRLQQQQNVVLDDGVHAGTSYSRVSPPKAIIDSSPLQSAMDRNKESLKVKLLVRRSFDQLVEQGIMPPLKTSPAIYEQRRQLERAKTGDMLKAKIKKRPDRVELEQRHILEQCDSNVDPSLAEKRRMLEKAILVDHLNSKISHRPGPLDLIGKNILHVEEPIERMVKEGLVDYASTLDESNVSVATPTTVGEGEDSLSSEGESLHSVATVALVNQPLLQQHPIQLQTLQTAQGSVLGAQSEFFTLKPTIPIVANDGTVLAAIATPVVTTTTTLATITAVNVAREIPMEQTSSSSSSTPSTTLRPILPTPSANMGGTDLSSVRPPTLTMTPMPPADIKHLGIAPSSGGGGKEKLSKKKSKSKSITKAKPIKFHEYKGPTSAHHRGGSSSSSSSASIGGHGTSSDSNYQLIMQQQYLLEYLEEMCKKPATGGGGIPSPSNRPPEPASTDGGDELAGSDQTPADSPLGAGAGGKGSSGSGTTAAPTMTDLAAETLNKLKVSQLKKYCKQYSLAVSGTKSNLIERLKPFLKPIDPGAPANVGLTIPNGGTEPELEDNLLAEQQKRIAELQLQLKKSQEELEQFRSLCNNPYVGPGNGAEQPMVVNQVSHGSPASQMSSVLVGSPFSISTVDTCETICADSAVTGSDGVEGSDKTPDHVTVDSSVPTLEGSFFLEGLATADSTTVDYGHNMEEILHPELSPALPVDHSPTHRPTLDKVLGQVQPTISGLTMNADAGEGSVSVRIGMPGSSLGGSTVGAAVGDMQNLSLSLKSVNFESVHGTGDTSMQQDAIMLNDFEDIDLVDFHMHSLDSDGPFPMITNHDPDPSAATTTDQHQHHTAIGLFDSSKVLPNSFAAQLHPQMHHGEMLHHPSSERHGYLNNNDIGSAGDEVLRLENFVTPSAKQQQQPAPPFGSLHHPHAPHSHMPHSPSSSHLHTSDSNNNNHSVRFAVQDQQPIASSSTSSSTSSTSSSPSNCFKALRTLSTSKLANKPLMHLHLHQQQQQQQQEQHQHHHDHHQQQHHDHHQHHPNAMDQLTAPETIANCNVTGDHHIDSFQDNAMDFESLLTNTDTDSVLTANNCHRMMLDCAQDKPMFSYLPDPSLLDYFTDDCNGHDYEIKHLEY